MLNVAQKQEETNVLNSKTKQFKLMDEANLFVISMHFRNLLTYFHPENIHVRADRDKSISANTRHILNTFDFLFLNTQFISEYSQMRDQTPIEFRCVQLIQYYGEETIKAYIRTIYAE